MVDETRIKRLIDPDEEFAPIRDTDRATLPQGTIMYSAGYQYLFGHGSTYPYPLHLWISLDQTIDPNSGLWYAFAENPGTYPLPDQWQDFSWQVDGSDLGAWMHFHKVSSIQIPGDSQDPLAPAGTVFGVNIQNDSSDRQRSVRLLASYAIRPGTTEQSIGIYWPVREAADVGLNLLLPKSISEEDVLGQTTVVRDLDATTKPIGKWYESNDAKWFKPYQERPTAADENRRGWYVWPVVLPGLQHKKRQEVVCIMRVRWTVAARRQSR
jgi:hypothetical protein